MDLVLLYRVAGLEVWIVYNWNRWHYGCYMITKDLFREIIFLMFYASPTDSVLCKHTVRVNAPKEVNI